MASGCDAVRHQEVSRRPRKTRARAAQNCLLGFFNKAVEAGSKTVTMYPILYKQTLLLFFFFLTIPDSVTKRKFLLSTSLILHIRVGATVPPIKPFKLVINFS